MFELLATELYEKSFSISTEKKLPCFQSFLVVNYIVEFCAHLLLVKFSTSWKIRLRTRRFQQKCRLSRQSRTIYGGENGAVEKISF